MMGYRTNAARLCCAALLAALVVPAGRTAAQSCDVTIDGCTFADLDHLNPTSLTRDRAAACLKHAGRFAEKPKCEVLAGTTFANLLPSSYEYRDRYHDGALDTIIRWAAGQPRRGGEEDRILLDATFRRASAHGMFGDDGLRRALNAAFEPDTQEDSLYKALRRLDSRVCAPSDREFVDDSELFRPALCSTDADCRSGETCRAIRFGSEMGVFGAIQEYRRAENAIVNAVQVLGVRRFQELDRELGCGGGCAGRLLVRLGAMRARAQAERADALWQYAVAAGPEGANLATCDSGRTGELCSIDRDCDTLDGSGNPIPGRCGARRSAARGFVLMRQAALEALAEAAASQTFYRAVLPAGFLESAGAGRAVAGTDFELMQAALADLSEISSRSASGSTPFGIPSDYVPFLTSVQKALLGCSGQTTGDVASLFSCLLGATTRQDFLNLLDTAAGKLEGAKATEAQFLDAAQHSANHEAAMKTDFESLVNRMFGPPCGGCSCTEAEQDDGRCFTLPETGQVWVVEQADCAEDRGSCNTNDVDGEIELQFQTIRNAEASLDAIEGLLEFNEEEASQTADWYARRVGISETSCQEATLAMEEAQNRIQAEYKKHRKKTRGFFDTKFIVKAAVAYVTGGAKQLGAEIVSNGPDLYFAREQQVADLRFRQKMDFIRGQLELTLHGIRCRRELAEIEIGEEEALLKVEKEKRHLLAQAEAAHGTVLSAVGQLNRLLAELRQARARYEEATELTRIWDAEAADFRNPQNYRALALAGQLEARQSFRRAQMLVWMVLRAAAYDLAEGDLNLPNCGRYACAGGCVDPGPSCSCTAKTDEEGEPLAATVAGSDGSCSLGSVFAARTVEDLRDLIRNAFYAELSKIREVQCERNTDPGSPLYETKACEKTVSLRDLFTDRTLRDRRRELGSVLLDTVTRSGSNQLAALDFGITLQRDFVVCPELPNGTVDCQPQGISGLLPETPGGTPAKYGMWPDDLWNARLLGVAAHVEYLPGQEPHLVRCRFPASGHIADPYWAHCSTTGGETCGDATCADNNGRCRCLAITASEPQVTLKQIGEGLVRTDQAKVGGPDAFRVYRVRYGNLTFGDLGKLEKSVTEALRYVPGIFRLQDSEARARVQVDDDLKTLPVAAARWRLAISTEAGVVSNPRYFEAFLEAIKDIRLIVFYQGFGLD